MPAYRITYRIETLNGPVVEAADAGWAYVRAREDQKEDLVVTFGGRRLIDGEDIDVQIEIEEAEA